MNLLFILAALLMLGIMVTVHEAGHFMAARMTGIPVQEFSIGFGPKLLSWKSKKHDTQFSLRVFPAGGYCMFYGEDSTDEKAVKEDPRAIGHYAVCRRMITIFMGPMMNFILALVVATALYGMIGEDTKGYYADYPSVAAVDPDGAAAQADTPLQPGDFIIAVNGEDTLGVTEDQTALKLTSLLDRYGSEGNPLTLTARRNGETFSFQITPRYNEQLGRYLMGVSLLSGYQPVYTPISLFRAVDLGAKYCITAGGAILNSLKNLVTTGAGFDQTSGPVGVVQLIAEETQRSAADSAREAVITYGELLVMISVNLGLFNLLPIPGLDGSRILFLLVEGIRRKPISQKLESYIHLTGYVLLLGVMLIMTYRDILRIFR